MEVGLSGTYILLQRIYIHHCELAQGAFPAKQVNHFSVANNEETSSMVNNCIF
jgi:hypothetical protein